ncbi:MAG: DUF3298 and DUF4163 domain-containing protein [Bacteroidales bacterium]|jgi:hypothetical protein|nr:DUF3298 and DUF4163 domain-containing protein [Bacteroidales bacterium]
MRKLTTIAIMIFLVISLHSCKKETEKKVFEKERLTKKETIDYDSVNRVRLELSVDITLPVCKDSSSCFLRNEIIKNITNKEPQEKILDALYSNIKDSLINYLDANYDFSYLSNNPYKELSYIVNDSFVYENNNFCSYAFYSSHFLGGAHGLYGVTYINYDIKARKTLRFSDIFDNSKIDGPTFKDMLLKQLLLQEAVINVSDLNLLDKDAFFVTDNIYLTQNDIVFVYNVYEIRPYSSGITYLKVPYVKLTPYLNKDFIEKIPAQIDDSDD